MRAVYVLVRDNKTFSAPPQPPTREEYSKIEAKMSGNEPEGHGTKRAREETQDDQTSAKRAREEPRYDHYRAKRNREAQFLLAEVIRMYQ